jgi:hypothetical protein
MPLQYFQTFPNLAVNYFNSMVTTGDKEMLVYMFFGFCRSYIQKMNEPTVWMQVLFHLD